MIPNTKERTYRLFDSNVHVSANLEEHRTVDGLHA